MGTYQLLRLTMQESHTGRDSFRLLYQDIVKLFWTYQFPGVTVIRSLNGIDDSGSFRFRFIEDFQFNHIPLIIETVHKKSAIQEIIPIIQGEVSRGELTVTDVELPFKEEVRLSSNKHRILRIYIQEQSHWFKEPLYQKLLSILQDNGFKWSTITRGIEGFGHDHVIHKQKLFSFSQHTPVIIEAVGEADKLQTILPDLKEMLSHGLLITMPVDIVMNF